MLAETVAGGGERGQSGKPAAWLGRQQPAPTCSKADMPAKRQGQGGQLAIVTAGGGSPKRVKEAPQTSQEHEQPHIGQPGKGKRHNHGDPVADRQASSRVT